MVRRLGQTLPGPWHMGDETKLSLKAIKARRLAAFDRAMDEISRHAAEINRIAAEHNLVVIVDIREGGDAPPQRKRASRLKDSSASSALTVEELAERYRTDDRSSYQTVRPASRKQYDKLLKYLIQH